MSLDTFRDALETFNNVPVFAFRLSDSITKSLHSVLAGFGLHLRKIDRQKDIEKACTEISDALIFLSADPSDLKLINDWVDSRRSLVIACSETTISKDRYDQCLATGVGCDFLDCFDHRILLQQRCRIFLELQQRRCLLRKEEEILGQMAYQRDRLLAMLPDGVMMVTGDGYLVELNDFALEALGYSRESLVGAHLSQLLCEPSCADPLLDWFEHPVYSAMVTQQDTELEDTVLWRSDGSVIPVNCSVATLYPGQQPEYLLVFQDISIRKVEEAQLDQLTRYDPVTGLANVSLMRHFLLKAMARVLRNDRKLAVLYIDLDDFHCINESFGTSGGDSLLRSVGRRLKNCIRTGDMVSRYQNDAFMVVLDEVRLTRDVEKLAEQILDKLNIPHDLSGVPVVAHASIGIAFYPQGAIGIDELIDQAKEAMEWVKLNGKNGRHVYGNDELSAAKSQGKSFVH